MGAVLYELLRGGGRAGRRSGALRSWRRWSRSRPSSRCRRRGWCRGCTAGHRDDLPAVLAEGPGRGGARPAAARWPRTCGAIGRASRSWRPGRWCRRSRPGGGAERNPVVAGLTAAVLLLVAAGFAGVTWTYWRAEASRRQLENALYFHRIALARRELSVGNLGRAPGTARGLPARPAPQWEWQYLERLCRLCPADRPAGRP